MFIVYVIYNDLTQSIYIGQTSNIERRLSEHRAKREKHFTAQKGNWTLIYQEEQPTRQAAIQRENQLKSFRGRQFVKGIINNSGNPE